MLFPDSRGSCCHVFSLVIAAEEPKPKPKPRRQPLKKSHRRRLNWPSDIEPPQAA
jgi:hypothetical protein